MSNKKNQKNEKWVRVGGFEVGTEKNANGGFVVCRSIAGNWSVRWRDDTLMYGMMLSIVGNEGVREYLHSLILAMFTVTTYTHDLVALANDGNMPFMQGLIELVNRQNDYEKSLKPEATEEEHAEALEDLRSLSDVTQEMLETQKEEENG